MKTTNALSSLDLFLVSEMAKSAATPAAPQPAPTPVPKPTPTAAPVVANKPAPVVAPKPAPYVPTANPAMYAGDGNNAHIKAHNAGVQRDDALQTKVIGDYEKGRLSPELAGVGLDSAAGKVKSWLPKAVTDRTPDELFHPGAAVRAGYEALFYDPQLRQRSEILKQHTGQTSNQNAETLAGVGGNQPLESAADWALSRGLGLNSGNLGRVGGSLLGRVGASVGNIVGGAGLPGVVSEIGDQFGWGAQALAGRGFGAEKGLAVNRDLQPNNPSDGASVEVRDELNNRMRSYGFKDITQLEEENQNLRQRIPQMKQKVEALKASGNVEQAAQMEAALKEQQEAALNYQTLLNDREGLHVNGGDLFAGLTHGSTIREHQTDAVNPLTGRSAAFSALNNAGQWAKGKYDALVGNKNNSPESGLNPGDMSQAAVTLQEANNELQTTFGYSPEELKQLDPKKVESLNRQAQYAAGLRKAYTRAGLDPEGMDEDLHWFSMIASGGQEAQNIKRLALDPNTPLPVRERIQDLYMKHNKVVKQFRDMQQMSGFDGGLTSAVLGASGANSVATKFNPVTTTMGRMDDLHQVANKPLAKLWTGTMPLREKVDPTEGSPKGTLQHWMKSKQRDVQDFLNPELVGAREGMNAADANSRLTGSMTMNSLNKQLGDLGVGSPEQAAQREQELRGQREQLMLKDPTSPEFKQVDEQWRKYKGHLDMRRLADQQRSGQQENYGASAAAHTNGWLSGLTYNEGDRGRMLEATPENPYENPLTFGKDDAQVKSLMEQAQNAKRQALISRRPEAAQKYDAMIQELQYGLKRRAGHQALNQAKDTTQGQWYNPMSWGSYLGAGALGG